MGKMETSRWCSDRSIPLRKNSLVTLSIQRFIAALDVRREGDVAKFSKNIRYLTSTGKADFSFSILHLIYLSFKTLLKLDSSLSFQPSCSLDQGLPFSVCS